MHLDTLKCFLYIVEEKSISKAALRAHISQSAASQMLSKLEEDFGYALLIRSNKGVSLTSRGEIALKYAQKIIKHYDQMQSELKSFDANNNHITITGTPSLASYSLPCMLYRIKKKFPEYQFSLAEKTIHDIIEDIKEGVSDFGFIDEIWSESPELVYHKLGQERVVLVAKESYYVKEQIQLEELLHVELIMCTMNSKICEHLDDALKSLKKKKEDLNVIFNADSMTAVKSSVLNGYGMAFVPYESVKHELYEKSIKMITVNQLDLNYDIYMVSKKATDLSQSVKHAKEYLLDLGRKSFC
jgi:DNA-binding transcriptional LysR family regulator